LPKATFPNGWQFGGGESDSNPSDTSSGLDDSDTDFHDRRDNPPLDEDDWMKGDHSLDGTLDSGQHRLEIVRKKQKEPFLFPHYSTEHQYDDPEVPFDENGFLFPHS
jgi:hypothetical protein